ncbi:MAG: nitronate monooxygenase [Actinomycetota bacterium]|nr:nitronate monooxygenase [Actinomycetota bacterium]
MFAQLAVPVIVAPMAGGPSTPRLVAGAIDAGASGFLAAGYLTAEALARQIADTRALTTGAFGVNLFVPGPKSTDDLELYRERVRKEAARVGTEPGQPDWDDDHYAAKVDVVVAAKVPAVSFTFGVPRTEDVERLHACGAEVIVTVTSPEEARLAAAAGADALCVQGAAAGAHRGTFTNDPIGASLYDLLPALRLIAAATGLPLIATGGLIHGADVAAVIAAGAIAAQLGTAFLRCPEAGTNETYRAALAAADRETVLTRAFSGRPARGLVNRFIVDNTDAPAAYPQVHNMTKPMRAAAVRAGDPELVSLWAGQGYPLATEAPVAEVIANLDRQARAAAKSLRARLG